MKKDKVKPMQVSRVVSPIAHVQQHPDLYLFASSRLSLVERLSSVLWPMLCSLAQAMCAGAATAIRHFVGSSFNWLGSADGRSDLTLFERVVPLTSAGENSIRNEICVAPLAEHVVTLVGFDVNVMMTGR